MVMKDATRGFQEGQRFWACDNGHEYKIAGVSSAITPSLNALNTAANRIKDTINQAFTSEKASGSDKQLQQSATVPRTLKARPRFKGHEVVFFETAAVTQKLLDSIKRAEKESSIVKAFTQWRLDYKPANKPYQLTDTQRQILSVTWKIVTRGRITLTSHRLENTLKERFLSKEMDNGESAVNVIEKAITELPEVNLGEYGWILTQKPNSHMKGISLMTF